MKSVICRERFTFYLLPSSSQHKITTTLLMGHHRGHIIVGIVGNDDARQSLQQHGTITRTPEAEEGKGMGQHRYPILPERRGLKTALLMQWGRSWMGLCWSIITNQGGHHYSSPPSISRHHITTRQTRHHYMNDEIVSGNDGIRMTRISWVRDENILGWDIRLHLLGRQSDSLDSTSLHD